MQLLLIGSMLAVLGGVGLVLGQVATGIFSSQSDFSAVNIANAHIYSDGRGTLTLMNWGPSTDQIARISVTGSTGIDFFPRELPGNTQTVIQFSASSMENPSAAGEQAIIQVHLSSGNIVTLPTKVLHH